jgi:MFS family permease
VGNILAAYSLGVVVPGDRLGWGWRGLYWIGALPGLIAFFVFWRLREPDRWVQAKAAAAQQKQADRFGRISDLFTDRTWRRNTLVGLGLAVAGQIGLWGVGFYTPELIDSAIPTVELATRPKIEAVLQTDSLTAQTAAIQALSDKEKRKLADLVSRATPRQHLETAQLETQMLPAETKQKVAKLLSVAITDDQKTRWKSLGGMLQQVAAGFGIYGFTMLATRWGRRPTFLAALLAAWGSLTLTFATFNEPQQIWYLWPLLGFCTLAPFGGYAIYFPELFPTRLRTTGTSFCYNVGRYVTAIGLFMLGPLAKALQGLTSLPGFRMAAIVLACSYVFGLVALIWAPETIHQPLPEDEKVGSH